MLCIRMTGGFVKFFREVMADGRCRGIPANIWLNINKSNPFLPSVSPSSGVFFYADDEDEDEKNNYEYDENESLLSHFRFPLNGYCKVTTMQVTSNVLTMQWPIPPIHQSPNEL